MMMKHLVAGAFAACLILTGSVQVFADEAVKTVKPSKKKSAGKTYSEIEFIKMFSHKSRQQVSEALGKPLEIAQASKPSDAESSVASMGQNLDQTKVDHVEMWYYKNLVRVDAKRTYTKTELTFVNDNCQNIAYFNEAKK